MKTHNHHDAVEMREVPKGEYLRLKPNGKEYVRHDYCHALKRYNIVPCDDAGSEGRMIKPNRQVFIGFTY